MQISTLLQLLRLLSQVQLLWERFNIFIHICYLYQLPCSDQLLRTSGQLVMIRHGDQIAVKKTNLPMQFVRFFRTNAICKYIILQVRAQYI